MNKRAISFCLAVILSLSLCGCGSYSGNGRTGTDRGITDGQRDMMPDPEDGYVSDRQAENGILDEGGNRTDNGVNNSGRAADKNSRTDSGMNSGTGNSGSRQTVPTPIPTEKP